MKIVKAKPYVWAKLPNGRLLPPLHLMTERMFVATDEGLLKIRCHVEEREFNPEMDEILYLPL